MKNSSPTLPRRQFLTQTALAGAALAFSTRHSTADEAPAVGRFPLIVFNKPFQKLNFEDTADVIAKVGWSGLECPVRAGGQILPEYAEDELPRLVEALKKRGLTFEVLTSDILAVNPRAEKILRTAAQLGIRRFRLGFHYYDIAKPIAAQLAEIKPALRDLAALANELGLRGGIQNHSGAKYVGAPIWDVHKLLHDIDPEHLGISTSGTPRPKAAPPALNARATYAQGETDTRVPARASERLPEPEEFALKIAGAGFVAKADAEDRHSRRTLSKRERGLRRPLRPRLALYEVAD